MMQRCHLSRRPRKNRINCHAGLDPIGANLKIVCVSAVRRRTVGCADEPAMTGHAAASQNSLFAFRGSLGSMSGETGWRDRAGTALCSANVPPAPGGRLLPLFRCAERRTDPICERFGARSIGCQHAPRDTFRPRGYRLPRREVACGPRTPTVTFRAMQALAGTDCWPCPH